MYIWFYENYCSLSSYFIGEGFYIENCSVNWQTRATLRIRVRQQQIQVPGNRKIKLSEHLDVKHSEVFPIY